MPSAARFFCLGCLLCFELACVGCGRTGARPASSPTEIAPPPVTVTSRPFRADDCEDRVVVAREDGATDEGDAMDAMDEDQDEDERVEPVPETEADEAEDEGDVD